MVVRELLVWKIAGIDNVVFSLVDESSDAADFESNCCLLTDTLQKKPAMIAVTTLAAQLRSREFTGILRQSNDLPPWLNVARFEGVDDVVLVAWISSPAMQIKLQTPAGATARNLYGQSVASGNQVFTLYYANGPVYVKAGQLVSEERRSAALGRPVTESACLPRRHLRVAAGRQQ